MKDSPNTLPGAVYLMDPPTPLQAVETDLKNVFLFLIMCACVFVNVCLHSTELGIKGLEQDL